MRTWIFLMFAAGFAAPLFALDVSTAYVHRNWEERDLDGNKFLEESGPLLAVGLGAGGKGLNRWAFPWQVGILLGEIDYDGASQSGEPVRTTTEYYGLEGHVLAERGLRISQGLELFFEGGPEVNTWLRRIDQASRYDSGYDEWWTTVHVRLGGRLEIPVAQGGRLLLGAGILLPVFEQVLYNIQFADGENPSLKPEGKPGFVASAGFLRNDWMLEVFLREVDFDRSEIEVHPPLEIYQPESHDTMAGVRLTVRL